MARKPSKTTEQMKLVRAIIGAQNKLKHTKQVLGRAIDRAQKGTIAAKFELDAALKAFRDATGIDWPEIDGDEGTE